MNFSQKIDEISRQLALETHYPCRMEVLDSGLTGWRANPDTHVGKFWVQLDGDICIRPFRPENTSCLCETV